MFRALEDFLSVYANMTEGTSKVLAAFTDGNLGQCVKTGHRTLGQLGWHVVATVPEMMNRTGLGLGSVDPESMPPATAKEITDAYRKVTQEAVRAIKANWNDKTLLETDDMYGKPWPRGATLLALVTHEVHHVGQMTVLLRQAGAKVPGIYGPAKEEWTQFGMEPPRY
jgi:uncharacterized damage-inducible protein DinB